MGPDDAQVVEPPALVAPGPEEARAGELTVRGLLGGRQLSVAQLDAPLRRSGYGPLPRMYGGAGFALDLAVARWRFDISMLYAVANASSIIDASQVSVAAADVGVYAGYDVLRAGGLTGTVLGGFGYS